jgi:RNA polymerase-associated protein
MTLYSNPTCFYSHRARLVMAEKSISIDVIDVEGMNLPEDLLDLNPYHSVPTLIDRDLILYDSRVIIEYLDERFPHPPLMPVDPVTRAQFRLALFRIEKDWYTQAQQIDDAVDKRQAIRARKILGESIIASNEVFAMKKYFLSDEFSLVDCTIAPILWRLSIYGIDLGSECEAIEKYMSEVFSRPSFQESLSELEQEMRP